MLEAATGDTLKEIPFDEPVWSGPSVSRGRVYIGTGSTLFFRKSATGTLYSFGLSGDDEVSRVNAGN